MVQERKRIDIVNMRNRIVENDHSWTGLKPSVHSQKQRQGESCSLARTHFVQIDVRFCRPPHYLEAVLPGLDVKFAGSMYPCKNRRDLRTVLSKYLVCQSLPRLLLNQVSEHSSRAINA